MKGFTQAALAGALVVAAGLGPASTARAQGREPAMRVLDATRGSRIGVSVRDVDEADTKDSKQAKSGVVVDSVDPGGPADKAGVKPGDAITEFDGERVRSVRQFSRLVQETPSGRAVSVALSRGGQRSTVTITAERASFGDDFAMRLLDVARPPLPPEPPAPARAPRAPSVPPVPAVPFEAFRIVNGRHLGVTIQTLDGQLAEYFGVKEGVLVTSVSANSVAEKAGLKAGDVITAVNGRHVYDAPDVTRALDRTEDSNEFTMEVQRDKKPQTLKGTLEPRTRSRGSVF